MAVLGEEDRELPRAQRIEGLRLIVEETDILPGIEFAQRLAQVGTLAPPKVSCSPRISTWMSI